MTIRALINILCTNEINGIRMAGYPLSVKYAESKCYNLEDTRTLDLHTPLSTKEEVIADFKQYMGIK